MNEQSGFSGGRNDSGIQSGMPDGNANPQGMNRPDWNNTGGILVSTGSNTIYALLIVILLIILTGTTVIIAKPRVNKL